MLEEVTVCSQKFETVKEISYEMLYFIAKLKHFQKRIVARQVRERKYSSHNQYGRRSS
jgi:hypothetical protein